MKMKAFLKNRTSKLFVRLPALLTIICLIPAFAASAEGEREGEGDWVDFLLLCNEGMNNERGNVGNTMMVVSMNQQTGKMA